MTCVLCRNGRTEPGEVTVTMQRGETTVIVKGVPAQVCDNCEEYYLDEEIGVKVMQMAEAAVLRNAEVEILRYAA